MRVLVILVTLALFSVSLVSAVCTTQSGYNAPYELSPTAQLSFKSVVLGTYFLQPCFQLQGCDLVSETSICWNTGTSGVNIDLGSYLTTTWAPINNDWWNGAVSTNTDMENDPKQCTKSAGDVWVKVNYICSKGDDSLTVSEPASSSAACQFLLTVDSSIVCKYQKNNQPNPGGGGGDGNGGSSGSKGLSGGWVFVIVLIVASFVYCTGGMAFNRIRQGKSGLEMVPNLSFWRNLPGLVKDGCGFTWAKIRGLCSGRSGTGLAGTSSTSSYETI